MSAPARRLATLALAAACASGALGAGLAAQGATAGAADHEGEVVLRVLTHERWFAAYDALEEVARDFEAAHPGVRVELLDGGGAAGGMDKVLVTLAGGLPLDVVWLDVTEFSSYLRSGILLDLQPFFDADPTWDPDAYFPVVLDAMRDGRGHLHGVCSSFTPYVTYVNLDLLEAAGLPRPPPDWTWADLERYARALTRDDDGDGRPEVVGLALTQWLQALAPWVWQNGGRFVADDGRVAFADPAAVEALAFLRRLLEEGIASDDATFRAQLEVGAFQAGRAALYGPVGYWETFHFRDLPFRWDVVPLPRGREAATAIAMRFYAVPKRSRHPDLAYAFVRELGKARMQEALAEIGNGVPGLVAAARSPAFLSPTRPPESERVFLDVLPTARFLPLGVDWRKAERVVQPWLEEAMSLRRVPVAEALARAAAAVEAQLAREAELAERPRLAPAVLVAAALVPLAVLLLLLARRLRRGVSAEERAAWLFLTPWAVGTLAFLAAPAALAVVVSLTHWNPVQGFADVRFLGADGWRRVLHDPTFRDALRVTLRYVLVAVPLQLVLALGLALLLRRPFRGVGALRTLFYLPTLLSPVVLAAIWRSALDPDGGLLASALGAVGLPPVDWLGDPRFVPWAFVLMALWTTGALTLVFLAGLAGVDPRLDEAARLDGAGAWARFRHVTLPALGPVLLFNAVSGTIQGLQLFAQPWVMTQGGPGNESRFLALYLYEQGFRSFDMGYAAVLGWVLFALALLATLLLLAAARRRVHYAGEGRR